MHTNDDVLSSGVHARRESGCSGADRRRPDHRPAARD